jgi:hypothetical protein
VSSPDEKKQRPRFADTDFFDRLAELDRDLPVTDTSEIAALRPAAAGPAERRRSSAMAPRDPRPLIDLFPPVEEPEPAGLERSAEFEADESVPQADVLDDPVCRPVRSPGRVAVLAAALVLLVAAGATAAAYLFRGDLAAILTAWQSR